MTNETSCGLVTLIGEPNSGKSTLLNQLVGIKLSIVTHKPQTTRTRVRGVTIENTAQIVFIDTPGLFVPKKRFDRALVSEAWGGVKGADVVLLLVDAKRGLTEGIGLILEVLEGKRQSGVKVVLVINKIDLVKNESLLSLSQSLNSKFNFDASFMISALKFHGIKRLRSWIKKELPIGAWLYPKDQISDMPLRLLASEITREKVFLRIHQEIPYQITVEPDNWVEKKDGSVLIEQIIYVSKSRYKGIFLGSNGSTIKMISISAREDIKKLLGQEVHLFLKVKVRENWFNEPMRYKSIGLNYEGKKNN